MLLELIRRGSGENYGPSLASGPLLILVSSVGLLNDPCWKGYWSMLLTKSRKWTCRVARFLQKSTGIGSSDGVNQQNDDTVSIIKVSGVLGKFLSSICVG